MRGWQLGRDHQENRDPRLREFWSEGKIVASCELDIRTDRWVAYPMWTDERPREFSDLTVAQKWLEYRIKEEGRRK